jgi:hypothetical protein
VALLAGIVLAAAVGVWQGDWSGRWKTAADPALAADRIARVPAEFNGWKGTDTPLDSKQLEVAEIAAAISRFYVNPSRNASISVLLVCGKPGPISVHTPEICYPGSGFDAVGETIEIPWRLKTGQTARFRRGLYRGMGRPEPRTLAIHWTWSTNGTWDAPDHPRLAYDPSELLYKIYLIQEVDPDSAEADEATVAQFADDFLATLAPILFHPH